MKGLFRGERRRRKSLIIVTEETVADTVIENVRHSNYGNQYILSFKRVCSLLFR